jgi:hypothetical protein
MPLPDITVTTKNMGLNGMVVGCAFILLTFTLRCPVTVL